MIFLLSLETDYFMIETKKITDLLNKIIDTDYELVFNEKLMNVFEKYVKIKQTPGSFAGTFSKSFVILVKEIISNKEKGLSLLNKVTYNHEDISLFLEEAMPSAGLYYLEAAKEAIYAASLKKEKLENEDLIVLSQILKPLKEQHSNKRQVIEKYISLLQDV